jgi:hypothetical protein
MSVAEIIREIEAYISRLREARALLTESAEARKRKRTSYSVPGKVTKSLLLADKNFEVRVRRRIVRNSRRGGAGGPADLQRNTRVGSATETEVGKLPTPSGLAAKRSQRTSQNRSPSSTRLPSPERKTPVTAHVRKVGSALGGQVPSGVVVVSPADAQRARDRSVRSEPRHRFLNASPQTGKAAFVALFGD